MTPNEQIQSWRRAGVHFEQDSDGQWRWTEHMREGPEGVEIDGAFSPPFATLERALADVEEVFGPA